MRLIEQIKVCVLLLGLSMMIWGCGKNNDETAHEIEAETTITPENTASTSVSEGLNETEGAIAELITDEQAIEAIRNYCCAVNPDLESIAAEGYPVYWEISSSDDSGIVVLFRSYTGAQVRYYIDRATGITNITEYVQGITDKEEPTGESFNVRDYIDNGSNIS